MKYLWVIVVLLFICNNAFSQNKGVYKLLLGTWKYDMNLLDNIEEPYLEMFKRYSMTFKENAIFEEESFPLLGFPNEEIERQGSYQKNSKGEDIFFIKSKWQLTNNGKFLITEIRGNGERIKEKIISISNDKLILGGLKKKEKKIVFIKVK